MKIKRIEVVRPIREVVLSPTDSVRCTVCMDMNGVKGKPHLIAELKPHPTIRNALSCPNDLKIWLIGPTVGPDAGISGPPNVEFGGASAARGPFGKTL